MMLTCAGCSKLARCPLAPKDMTITTHTCDSWETASYDILRARGRTYRTFGPIARQGFVKEKGKYMLPADIIASVENGEVQKVESLLGNDSVQPSQLMLCAAKLTGDAAGIAAQLKEAKTNDERKEILVGILVAKAVIAQERAENAQEAPDKDEVEDKPRRRRTSRKKADSETDVSEIENAKAAEKVEEVSDKPPCSPTNLNVLDIDLMMLRLNEMRDVNNTLMLYVISLSKSLETANARIEQLNERVCSLASNVRTLDRKADMQRDAFCGFEIELIGSGTINATPFADSTADWNTK